MKKRIVLIILAVVMLFGAMTVFAEGENTEITVYLTMSKEGEIVKSKNGDDMAYKQIVLNGQSSYTIDDAFKCMHAIYYEDGEEGYATSVSEWGLGVDKLWGDQSGNFGYQVNGAEEMVSGPTHLLKDGDHIEAVIYKNYYPDTESYSKFDNTLINSYSGKEIKITLFESGYDENWSMVFTPCANAYITINGVETEYVTDENGEVFIKAEDEGEYIISARKEKVLNEENVPAICAPVCILSVKPHPANEIIHNIAKLYTEIDISEDKSNLPWILADLAIYGELFPESEFVLTDEKNSKYLKTLINSAKETEKPGDMAKTILALRSLGYDAERIFLKDFERINLVSKLLKKVDENDSAVTNVYTLPYVLIALSQSDEYMSKKQREKLISTAVESKGTWLDTEFGTDGLTPMILALSPYYEENEAVKSAVDEGVETLKLWQREDGLIDGFEGYEGASTGLAICAVSALDINADEVKNGEKSLIDGLLSTANEDKSAFLNAFATEQGFRGLLSWKLLCENKGKAMYDFSDYPMKEINLSPAKYCPVIFDISPNEAKITINGGEEIGENCYDISEGTYTYTVSKSGYTNKTGSIEISEEDVLNHSLKNIEVSLSKKKITASTGTTSGGGNYGGAGVTVKEEEKEEIKPSAQSVFADVKESDWFYDAVQYVYENKLFGGTNKGFEPAQNMTRAMLVTVLHRFDGSDEVSENNTFADVSKGSWYEDGVKWAVEKNIVKGISETQFAPDSFITREQLAVILYRYAKACGVDIGTDAEKKITSFADFENISDYALEAMQFAVEEKIINGKENNLIAPGDVATRAEVATMIMRFAKVVK